jgi:hypothetical protein
MLAAVSYAASASSAQLSNWHAFNLLFGVWSFLLFGFLLQDYPVWLQASPVRYARFGLVGYLLAASQVLFHLFIWLSAGGPGLLYLSLLLVAWVLALATLKGIQILAVRGTLLVLGFNVLLWLGAICLLLTATCLLLGWHELIEYALWLGFSMFFLPSGLLLVLGHRLYPR